MAPCKIFKHEKMKRKSSSRASEPAKRGKAPSIAAILRTPSEQSRINSKLLDEITSALQGDDMTEIGRAKAIIDTFCSKYTSYPLTDELREAIESLNDRLNRWKTSLVKISDHVELFDETGLKWFEGKVLEISDNTWLLSWPGLPKFPPESVVLSERHVLPIGSYILNSRYSMSQKKKKNKEEATEIDTSIGVTDESIKADENKVEDETEMVTTKSGRTIKTSKVVDTLKKSTNLGRKKEEFERDNNDWVCGICNLMESVDSSALMLCDGPCLRSFHLGCLKSKTASTRDKWLCSDCTKGFHHCIICGEYGRDIVEVTKCKDSTCGKYYHHKCLVSNSFNFDESVDDAELVAHAEETERIVAVPYLGVSIKTEVKDVQLPVVTTESPSKRKKEEFVDIPLEVVPNVACHSFLCPRHICDTCHPIYRGKEIGKGTRRPIIPCFKCPRAYHENCIPPGSRYNSMYLLCPDHPITDFLPSKDVVSLDNLNLESLITNEAQIWKLISLPDATPDKDDLEGTHYRLPIQLREEVSGGEPNCQMISRLIYGNHSLPVHYQTESCVCKGTCDEKCLNRISKIECSDKHDAQHKKEPSICAVGGDCGNRLFTNKTYAKYERFREHAMGWGLRATEAIKEGSLVIEYIGEVIDEAEMNERMNNQKKFSPLDHDFYIMQIDNGYYVDGKHKGNASRFINHSCDPNCELQRWVVNHKMRIGIFAIKDIVPGEPLSYDYQFDTMEAERFKCYCGAETCRGTMAPKKKGTKESLSKSERTRLIEAGKRKDKVRTTSMLRQEEWKRSYTCRKLPGTVGDVINGPALSSLDAVRQHKISLARCILKGTDFRRRRRLMWVKRDSIKKRKMTSK